jgi:hypothetical protein
MSQKRLSVGVGAVFLVGAALCIACGSTQETSSSKIEVGLSSGERYQLKGCRNHIADPTEWQTPNRIGLLAVGCGEALGFNWMLAPRFPVEHLIEKTDYFCNASVAETAARAVPEDRATILVEGCGDEYYGLTKENAHHLSMDWFLGQRAAAWAVETMSRAGGKDKRLVASVKVAMLEYWGPLPVTARVPGLYELPGSLSPAATSTNQYLLVDESSIKVVERATLRLTENGAVLVDPLAATAAVDVADIRNHLHDQRGKKPGPIDMATVEKLAEPRGPRRYVAKNPRRTRQEAIDSASKARREYLQGARRSLVLSGKQQRPSPATRDLEDWAPLLVADKSLPAQRILSVVDGLRESGVYMGVGYESLGLQAMIPFGRTTPTPNRRPLTALRAQLLLRDDAFEMLIEGQKYILPRDADGSYPYELLTDMLQTNGDVDSITILISASGNKATYRELISVLDAAQEAGLEVAVAGPGGNKLR